MSVREFKKVFDKTTGRKRYRHYTGGPYYDSLKHIDPLNYKGYVGLGFQPPSKIQFIVNSDAQSVEEKAKHTGEEIINRLRLRQGGGTKQKSNITTNDISNRIQQLIIGKGLIVN